MFNWPARISQCSSHLPPASPAIQECFSHSYSHLVVSGLWELWQGWPFRSPSLEQGQPCSFKMCYLSLASQHQRFNFKHVKSSWNYANHGSHNRACTDLHACTCIYFTCFMYMYMYKCTCTVHVAVIILKSSTLHLKFFQPLPGFDLKFTLTYMYKCTCTCTSWWPWTCWNDSKDFPFQNNKLWRYRGTSEVDKLKKSKETYTCINNGINSLWGMYAGYTLYCAFLYINPLTLMEGEWHIWSESTGTCRRLKKSHLHLLVVHVLQVDIYHVYG